MYKGIDHLSKPASDLKKVGPKVVKLLEKLHLRTVGDILYHTPVRYLDFSTIKKLNDAKLDEDVTVCGEIISAELKQYPKIKIFTCIIKDETSVLPVVWFNQPYLQNTLQPGKKIFLSGKISKKLGRMQMENPIYELCSDNDSELTHTGRIIPMHPTTLGLSKRQLRTIIKSAIEYTGNIGDPLAGILPSGFLSLTDAISLVHFPGRTNDYNEAIKRFGWEECFYFFLMQFIRKYFWKKQEGIVHQQSLLLEKAIKDLPFSLTAQQKKCLEDILADMGSPNAMSRLIQGDVGSGKTVVAFLSMINAAGCGFQSVMMAPTEILAEQHYERFGTLFGGLGIESVLLTGSVNSTSRKKLLEAIENGKALIIIGTHALIQEKIVFNNLSLIVIDEQHKFGVEQRNRLKAKAISTPDVLMLTATPIPRTLSSVIYGDLDVNIIDEFPNKQRIVETHVKSRDEEDHVISNVKELIGKGKQAFIVCPAIDEGGILNLQNVEKEFERWGRMLYPYRVGKIHGKLGSDDKMIIMKDFSKGFLDVLICTSVIEVGIDVPNATVMVINNSERFGLAQLHQMRGRIGRSGNRSYCFLIADSHSKNSFQRLKAMEQYSDGFALSEIDLKLRGEGEFLGIKQWGRLNFKFIDLIQDIKTFQAINNLVSEIFKEKSVLEKEILMELKRRYPLHRKLIEEFESNIRSV